MTLSFRVPKYEGELPIFDPSDVIEGEEECRAYDEGKRKAEEETTNPDSPTESSSSSRNNRVPSDLEGGETPG